MAVEKGLRSEQKSSTARHLIDIISTAGLESQRPLPKDKSMHYLSLVKPQMMQQVLSFRGSCEERKAISMSCHSHMKRCGEGQSMELFPLHPGFATTKSINSTESAHQLQGRSVLTPSEVEGVQPPASRSPCPATTQHKQSFTQLTIFYNGTVNAYDVPADKAQTIMNMLGGNGRAHLSDPDPNIDECVTYIGTPGSSSSPPIWKAASAKGQNEVPIALPIPAQTATAQGIKEIENLHGADLPLARKQSLQRFLEKRQMRLKSVAPYATS